MSACQVTVKQVQQLLFRLVLDRWIQVSPVALASMEGDVWRRAQLAICNEDHLAALISLERLWCPSRSPEDQEWCEHLERPRVPSSAEIAGLKRHIQHLRQGGSGRGLPSVVDAMIKGLRAMGVKVLVEEDALRVMVLKLLSSTKVESPVERLGEFGVPPMPGPGSGGAPAEARVSDAPPKARPPEPDLDRRERNDEADPDLGEALSN